MPLELTTRFTPITTGAGSKHQKSPADAVASGAAHLQYILRARAMSEVSWSGVSGESDADRRRSLRDRMRILAAKGGKLGARVAEKGIVSLPNSWPPEARQDAVERLSGYLAPSGSEAMAVVVTHRDKPGNSHLHFLALDGAESKEAAKARRPDAKRIRRAQVIRLGDRGRPQELRQSIAEILNQIAIERGLEGVEWRSFKDRDVRISPTLHEGPTRRVRAKKTGKADPTIQENERLRQERQNSFEDDDFLRSEGTPINFEDFDKKAIEEPKIVHSDPVREADEKLRFSQLKERILKWAKTASKSRPPRSR